MYSDKYFKEHNSLELNGAKLFRKNEKIFIHKSNELPEFVAILHKHDFVELTYVISGSCVHVSGNTECILHKGDLIVVNAYIPHMNVPINTSNEDFVAYDCIFTPDFIDSGLIGSRNFYDLNSSFIFSSLFPKSKSTMPDIQLLDGGCTEFKDLFYKMHLEYINCEKGYIELIRAHLIEIFIKLFRELDDKYSDKLPYDKIRSIELAIDHLKYNYNTEITLEDAALRSFLSKSYFSKLFKEVTGNNFIKYLQQLRIDEACRLLLTTTMNIDGVCRQSGFNDMKFFYSVFKRYKGMTPGEFRKKHQ